MKKKVCIIGGGVGGLSTAFQLTQFFSDKKIEDKYEIHIYERNSELGGQARTSWCKESNEHTEYCWHAFGSGYVVLLSILDIIRDNDGNNVLSHLQPFDNFIYAGSESIYYEKFNIFFTDPTKFIIGIEGLYGEKVSLKDKYNLLKMYLKCKLVCEERLETYDHILWEDYVARFSPNIRRWLLDATSIILGMDYKKLSKHFMFYLMRLNKVSPLISNLHTFNCLDGPMNDVMFDPWQNYLESKDVCIHLNTTIDGIYLDSDNKNMIKYITINNENRLIDADYFINATGVESLADLYPKDVDIRCNANIETKHKYELLSKQGHQIQTQVTFYLPWRIQPIRTTPSAIILHESPWFIMVRIEGEFWDTIDYDILSTGIGMWDVPGSTGKTALQCNRNELATECWYQICNSKHNLKLSNKLPKWHIWDSFQFSEETQCMSTWEPKFSNSVDTLSLRPNLLDSNISNLYHATAYTRSENNTFNMESAAEAGVNVANLIHGLPIKTYKIKPNWFTRFIRWIDSLIFKLF